MASSSQSLGLQLRRPTRFWPSVSRSPKRSPKSSRAIAAVITVFNFPHGSSLLRRDADEAARLQRRQRGTTVAAFCVLADRRAEFFECKSNWFHPPLELLSRARDSSGESGSALPQVDRGVERVQEYAVASEQMLRCNGWRTIERGEQHRDPPDLRCAARRDEVQLSRKCLGQRAIQMLIPKRLRHWAQRLSPAPRLRDVAREAGATMASSLSASIGLLRGSTLVRCEKHSKNRLMNPDCNSVSDNVDRSSRSVIMPTTHRCGSLAFCRPPAFVMLKSAAIHPIRTPSSRRGSSPRVWRAG